MAHLPAWITVSTWYTISILVFGGVLFVIALYLRRRWEVVKFEYVFDGLILICAALAGGLAWEVFQSDVLSGYFRYGVLFGLMMALILLRTVMGWAGEKVEESDDDTDTEINRLTPYMYHLDTTREKEAGRETDTTR